MYRFQKYYLSISVTVFVFTCLFIIQLKVQNPIILLERFIDGGGWIEAVVISVFGGLIAYKMQDPASVPHWRRFTWTLFSIVFFTQLILGMFGFEKFLMTGKLHLPVPAMIISGPIYRGELTFMVILFLSTIVLSGPAWCSQLCYFGAIDSIASGQKLRNKPLRHPLAFKFTALFMLVTVTICLKFFGVSSFYATILGGAFGIIGILIIIFFSTGKGKMVHCIKYCPIGTIINYFRFISPFRMVINQSCTLCMNCTPSCKYDALNVSDIRNQKPGITCTMCGDCLSTCRESSIKYKFLGMKPEAARSLYLFISISLYSIFLAVARI